MKREKVIELFNEYVEAGNRVNAYYVTYKETDNIISQKWGKLKTADELNAILDGIEKSSVCVQGELPFSRLIFYSDDQCLAVFENPMWDCVNDESDASHIAMTVPFISREGTFGTIKEWVNNRFELTSSDMVGGMYGFPIGVAVKMLEHQLSQTGKSDVGVFTNDIECDKKHGGFDWNDTEEGFEFWAEVIAEHRFDVFFGKHPDYKRYNF